MGLFKTEPTELEVLIKESFNSEHKEEYNFEIETEGSFVEIKLPIVQETNSEGVGDGDNIKSKRKLPNE
tara:strand:+ start:536 stop:742 length:207 start_codon:yes stop_codon:yes gene_type:complete